MGRMLASTHRERYHPEGSMDKSTNKFGFIDPGMDLLAADGSEQYP